ncbi:MAG: reverse transcriptase domain-containing protein [Microcystaceae cyanobacterium]
MLDTMKKVKRMLYVLRRRKQSKTNTAKPTQLYGVTVPRNVDNAYQLDKENGNNLWRDAMKKEIDALLSLNTFKFTNRKTFLHKNGDWQYAPLTMIFTVKPDLRCKARLVAGGHVTDATMYDTYASTVSTANICLLIYLIVHNNTNVISGDIGTAYVNAYTEEKIYSHAGPEFGDKKGMKIILRKALYGLKSSANAWYHHLGNDLREMGFSRSRLDPSIWYRMRDDGSGYDYIAHHVDDFVIVADDPTPYLKVLEDKYVITGGDIPELYLGQTLAHDDVSWTIATDDYIKKCLVNVAKIIEKNKIGHQSTPNKVTWEPDLYTSPLLNVATNK